MFNPKKHNLSANLGLNSAAVKAFLAAPVRQNAALRRAVASASAAAAKARTPSPPKRRNSPPKNKPKSPPKRRNSPPRVAGPLPFALPKNIANRAVAHAISPNGKSIAYLLANKPTGRNYNFKYKVPWNQVQAGVLEMNVPRR